MFGECVATTFCASYTGNEVFTYAVNVAMRRVFFLAFYSIHV